MYYENFQALKKMLIKTTKEIKVSTTCDELGDWIIDHIEEWEPRKIEEVGDSISATIYDIELKPNELKEGINEFKFEITLFFEDWHTDCPVLLGMQY